MSSTTKKYTFYLLGVITIIFVLYLLHLIIANNIIFPDPLTSLKALGSLLVKRETYVILGYTFLRLLISLAVSFIIGGLLGILAGRYVAVKHFLKPWMTLFRSLTLASIIVIIMIVLGFSLSPYVICMLMLIPIIYEAFLNGISNLDADLMQVLKLESSFNMQVLFNIIFPLAKPFINTAFIQSVGLGVKVLVMAEFICNTKNSIGNALVTAANYLEYDKVFAWSFIAVMFVVIVEAIPKLLKPKSS